MSVTAFTFLELFGRRRARVGLRSLWPLKRTKLGAIRSCSRSRGWCYDQDPPTNVRMGRTYALSLSRSPLLRKAPARKLDAKWRSQCLYALRKASLFLISNPSEGASGCQVVLGRADCSLQGTNYTLFSERPITAVGHESKIWVLRVSGYRPSKVGVSWPDSEDSMNAGPLHNLLTELRIEGSTSPH